jgi:PAS domain S-box-containing protein
VALVLPGVFETNFFFLFLAGVVVSAWLGGLGPGLLATLLSALAIPFLLEPRHRFAIHDAGDVGKLAALAVLGGIVSLLCDRMRRAWQSAERQAEENARLAMQLQEQTVELETQSEEAQALNEELEQQIEEATALRLELEAANRQLRAAGAEADASRLRLASVLETMVEGVALVDPEGRITYANAAAARILGAERPRELHGVRFDDPRFHPAGPDGAPLPSDQAPVARVLSTGRPVAAQEVEMRADARRSFLRVGAAPLRGSEGALTGVVVSFDDVTADREAEAALRESEARFRAMADSAPVLIWTAGPDGRCDYFNRPWLEFTGRALEQELGDGWIEGVHPDDRPRCLALYRSGIEARRAFQVEYRLRRRDGEYRWVLDHGAPRFAPDGSFAGFIGSCIDITERREAEERQRFLAEAGTVLASSLEYEETLRQVCRLSVPAVGDFVIVDLLDDDGGVHRVDAVHADPAAEPLMAVLRRHPPDLSRGSGHPAAGVLRTGVPKVANDLAPGALDPVLGDPEHRAAIRRLAPTAYMVVPLVARGRILEAITFSAAGSARRYDEAELVRAEELARRAAFAIDNARLYERAVEANRAKADFLAVMSHELRTPLNAIIGYTDLFLYGVPAPLPDAMRPQMERVKSAARHLLELIEEILTFARLEAGQEEVRAARVSAAAVVQEAAALVEPLALERGIAFRVEGPEPDFAMVADARKVRQVLGNLLGNAVKFTERGRALLQVRREGGEAVFVVSDTGIGIAPGQMERIFEPFWQADQGLMRSHGGAGLGLSVARRLARLMGGDVTAESAVGEGSRFTLRLPVEYGST